MFVGFRGAIAPIAPPPGSAPAANQMHLWQLSWARALRRTLQHIRPVRYILSCAQRSQQFRFIRRCVWKFASNGEAPLNYVFSVIFRFKKIEVSKVFKVNS